MRMCILATLVAVVIVGGCSDPGVYQAARWFKPCEPDTVWAERIAVHPDSVTVWLGEALTFHYGLPFDNEMEGVLVIDQLRFDPTDGFLKGKHSIETRRKLDVQR